MIIEIMGGNEITPETKVRLSLKDAIVILLAVGGFGIGVATYFGWIPAKAQTVNAIAYDTLVTKDKLADTIIPIQIQIDNMKKDISEFKEGQKEMRSDIKEILKRLKDD